MPAKRESKRHNAEALCDGEDRQTSTRRHFCTRFQFWTACGDKSCLRAHACAGDATECFPRFWQIVPEDMKVGIRAAIEANRAGLSPAATEAHIERALARWDKMMSPQAADEPAPQAQPIAPVATGPRVRVL